MILAFNAPIAQPPPPAVTVPPTSTRAVSRTNARLPRVEQVALISPWRPSANRHREGGEAWPGGFGTASDAKARGEAAARAGGFPTRSGFAGAGFAGAGFAGAGFAGTGLAGARGLPMVGSIGFLAQVFGQESGLRDPTPLGGHRDGPSLGSRAYRRAGADPELYSEDSALIRFAA